MLCMLLTFNSVKSVENIYIPQCEWALLNPLKVFRSLCLSFWFPYCSQNDLFIVRLFLSSLPRLLSGPVVPALPRSSASLNTPQPPYLMSNPHSEFAQLLLAREHFCIDSQPELSDGDFRFLLRAVEMLNQGLSWKCIDMCVALCPWRDTWRLD